ncbi:hypothetical protein [Bacteroides thetaiotaomicron]|uniref:hypothetical protein n=1 Tax=Bacteroides thetaiotaomicron TaxID=818 RepID=UPI001E3677E2|nr:hypothetical protein [Bacteroides thetaiotaomicron]
MAVVLLVKLSSIQDNIATNNKRLNNPIFTLNPSNLAKRYFSGSLRDFQKCGINTVEIKKEWEKVIYEIQKEIINN